MGLAHLKPHQPCFFIASAGPAPKKKYHKHEALKGRDYTSASALCETESERDALKARFIAKWNTDHVLRVNKPVDLGAHGGQTKGQKAPR